MISSKTWKIGTTGVIPYTTSYAKGPTGCWAFFYLNFKQKKTSLEGEWPVAKFDSKSGSRMGRDLDLLPAWLELRILKI